MEEPVPLGAQLRHKSFSVGISGLKMALLQALEHPKRQTSTADRSVAERTGLTSTLWSLVIKPLAAIHKLTPAKEAAMTARTPLLIQSMP